eukprot:1929193-Rhodomonas_salina.1
MAPPMWRLHSAAAIFHAPSTSRIGNIAAAMTYEKPCYGFSKKSLYASLDGLARQGGKNRIKVCAGGLSTVDERVATVPIINASRSEPVSLTTLRRSAPNSSSGTA